MSPYIHIDGVSITVFKDTYKGEMDVQVYLAVTPEEYQDAARHCRAFAHVAYRIGQDSTLLRQSLLLQTKGGLLTVSDQS